MTGVVRPMAASLCFGVLTLLGVGVSRAAERPRAAAPPLQLPVCQADLFSHCAAQIGDLTVLHLRDHFYMIAGDGENIGVQVGQDGVFVVNTGTDAGASGLQALVRRISLLPIRMIVDTNADAETVGGNAALAGSSSGARFDNPVMGPAPATSIVANDVIMQRMMGAPGVPAAYASAGIPNNPFPRSLSPYRLLINGEPIVISDQPAASSDADSFVLFRQSDVVMAGDVMDMNRFPVIDLAHGGSIDGEIAALTNLEDLVVGPAPFTFGDPGTYVVSAHGRVADNWEVIDYREMMVIIRDTVAHMMKQHMSLAQIEAAHPALGFEPVYGASTGPWTTTMFIEAIYKSLQAKKKS
ncbi:MAG TPA: hypothetical protein VHY19_03700 [Steroidobacteraceae bacterium]|jgi:hypothetical protein|nr:hypothetical protein [Steroidobacteraceae bacterium]